MLNRKSVIESDSFPNYKFSKYNTEFEKYIDLCNEKKYRCSAVLGNEPIPKRLLQRYNEEFNVEFVCKSHTNHCLKEKRFFSGSIE